MTPERLAVIEAILTRSFLRALARDPHCGADLLARRSASRLSADPAAGPPADPPLDGPHRRGLPPT